MLDFQQLKVQEHHSQLEIDEKKRMHGLFVSQPFPHPLYVPHAAPVAGSPSYYSSKAPKG
jgi:hypothetical protein